MKPAPFEYVKPASLEEAGLLLSRHSDAKLLAGGQTLVPMLNFRLVSPALLVDINDLPALDTIVAGPGGLHLGALVRWYQIAASKDIARACPLLSEAVAHVAHYQIRNRGTWAGSCAHADPAAEFPAVAIASGAVFELYSVRGRRSVPAENFFLGPLTTALEPDEILIGASFPLMAGGPALGFRGIRIPPGRLCHRRNRRHHRSAAQPRDMPLGYLWRWRQAGAVARRRSNDRIRRFIAGGDCALRDRRKG